MALFDPFGAASDDGPVEWNPEILGQVVLAVIYG